MGIISIVSSLESKGISELKDLMGDIRFLANEVTLQLNHLRDNCKHQFVIREVELDPHKGYTGAVLCKECRRSMYQHKGNYYPYPVSSGLDDIKRELVDESL